MRYLKQVPGAEDMQSDTRLLPASRNAPSPSRRFVSATTQGATRAAGGPTVPCQRLTCRTVQQALIPAAADQPKPVDT
jgi:hypothetical protein